MGVGACGSYMWATGGYMGLEESVRGLDGGYY